VAHGRTWIDERCAWQNGDTNIAIGLYYEHFVEHGDRWLFKWRMFETHYRGPAGHDRGVLRPPRLGIAAEHAAARRDDRGHGLGTLGLARGGNAGGGA